MDKKVLTLAGIIMAVSVGTYAVLTLVKPHKHEEVKVADVYSSDQMFAGQVNPNGPDETPVNGAPTQPAAAAEPASAEAQPMQQIAAASAPESTAPASTDAMTTPVEGGAAPAAAPAPAESAPAAPAQQTAAAESAPAPAAAEPAPAAAPPAPAAPAAEPAPAPAPEAAPAPKPAKPKHAAAPKKKSKSAGKTVTAKAWWPAENPNQLSLIYAGPASFKKAIVLMFNGAFFKPDSPNASLKVTDSKGKAVSGSWELGENNRRMLVFPVSAGGSYKVSVGSGLTDSKNRKLGSTLSGAVVVP